jgi:hypothetical protein
LADALIPFRSTSTSAVNVATPHHAVMTTVIAVRAATITIPVTDMDDLRLVVGCVDHQKTIHHADTMTHIVEGMTLIPI